jgi:hypothetical protein
MNLKENFDIENNFNKTTNKNMLSKTKQADFILGLKKNTFSCLFFITSIIYLVIAYLIIVYK